MHMRKEAEHLYTEIILRSETSLGPFHLSPTDSGQGFLLRLPQSLRPFVLSYSHFLIGQHPLMIYCTISDPSTRPKIPQTYPSLC